MYYLCTLKLIKTYKYKLKPNNSQVKTFESWINTCRYIYNVALEERIVSYKKIKKSVSKYEQYNQLPEIKKEFPFISEVYSDVLQESLDRVDKAYKSFFRGLGFPKFAKKGFYNSFTFKRHFSITEDFIKLPKIGKVKYFNSRTIKGNVKTAIIIKEQNNFFICITTEIDIPETTIDKRQAVGVDIGIAKFCYMSDGSYIESPLFLELKLKKLRSLNRKLSRQKKGSKEREKTKYKLQKLHLTISNTRRDFLHKQSTFLSNKYSMIVMENINLQKMKSINSTLTRKMSDSGFGVFREMLKYKNKERGKCFSLVNPAYTSQTCYSCGVIDKKSRVSQSEFVCTNCGVCINADENAAKEILRRDTSQITQSEALA